MTFDLAIIRLAEGLAAHASARQSVISENIANADTPGYRARDIVPFSEAYENGQPQPASFVPAMNQPGHGGVGRGAAVLEREFDSRTGADSPNRNDVSLEDQMIRSAEVRMQHDLAIGVYRKSMEILRRGLGRGR